MTAVELQPIARVMSEYASQLIRDVPSQINNVPNEDIRRFTAASLADQKIGSEREGSLQQLVEKSTLNLSSKETGFIAWALDVLKGLFVQRRDQFSKEEIRSALKEKIPTLSIPLSSENRHGDRGAKSFTFTTVEDKKGEQYKVTLWVKEDYTLDSLGIYRSSANSRSLHEKINLSGINPDQEILNLITQNKNILSKES